MKRLLIILLITLFAPAQLPALTAKTYDNMANGFYTSQSVHADTASAFSNTPSMMSTNAAEQKKFKEEIENPSKRIKQQDIQKIEQKKVSITDDTKFTPTKKDASPVKSDDSGTAITVLNEKNKPLNGVKVCYNETCLETSAKGTVYFDFVINSTADLTIQSDAYKQKTIKRTKSTDKSSEFTITCIKDKNEAVISIVNSYANSEKFSNVKICTDKNNKNCKKTDMYGTATFTNGQTIYIDRENYECTPQIATINDNETIDCKKICSDKDLKKVSNATKCYVKPGNQYEVVSCKYGYKPTGNKSACIETGDDFEEEDIDTSYSDCLISGGDWNGTECECDKQKGLKQSKDKKTCECRKNKETYNIETKNCEKNATDNNPNDKTPMQNNTPSNETIEQLCPTSGGTWNGTICECDKSKGLTGNNKTQLCECNEPSYIYNSTQKKCIKQEITMEQYKKLESEISKIIEETKKTIETQCSTENEVSPEGCQTKNKLITQFEQLKTDALKELKELGRKQYE